MVVVAENMNMMTQSQFIFKIIQRIILHIVSNVTELVIGIINGGKYTIQSVYILLGIF